MIFNSSLQFVNISFPIGSSIDNKWATTFSARAVALYAVYAKASYKF